MSDIMLRILCILFHMIINTTPRNIQILIGVFGHKAIKHIADSLSKNVIKDFGSFQT